MSDKPVLRKAYMHTLDGQPAFFSGDQICFLPPSRARNVLRGSIQEIYADRKATEKYRKKHNFRIDNVRYGYRMFYV